MTNEENEEVKFLLVIPNNIWQEFKSVTTREKTLNDLIVDLLVKETEELKKLNKKN
jgi:hypothetical protein